MKIYNLIFGMCICISLLCLVNEVEGASKLGDVNIYGFLNATNYSDYHTIANLSIINGPVECTSGTVMTYFNGSHSICVSVITTSGGAIDGNLTISGILALGNLDTNFINTTHILDGTIQAIDLDNTLDIANYTGIGVITVSEHVITSSGIPSTNVAFINNTQNFALEQTIGGGWPNGISLRPIGDLLVGRDLYVGGQIIPVDGSSVNGSFFPLTDALGDLGKINASGSFRWGNVYIKDLIVNNGTTETNILKVLGSGNSYFSGSVGIGTTDPFAKLMVANASGNSIIVNQRTGAITSYWTAHGSGYTEFASDVGGFRFANSLGGTSRLAIDTNGNVGIGTSNPAYTLDVKGQVYLNNSLFVDNVGNVGIGATAPGAKLEIKGVSPVLRMTQTATNEGTQMQFYDGPSTVGGYMEWRGSTLGANPNRFDMVASKAGSSLGFWTSGTEAMRIQSDQDIEIMNGNVGIGTTAPTANLHIHGTANTVLLNLSAPSGQTNMSLMSPDGKTWQCGVDNSGSFTCG